MSSFDIEALDQLGSVLVKAEPLETARPSGAIKREPAEPQEGRSGKKARRGALLADVSPVKSEPREDGEGDSEQEGSETATGSSEAPICHGCGRVKGTDPSWIDGAMTVPWAFARGLWCRDCHLTWRTMHSYEHTLVMFAKWLKAAENKKAFQMNVLAWCSLVNEGNSRITAGQIANRASLLQWLFQQCRIPVETALRRTFKNWPAEANGSADLALALLPAASAADVLAVAPAQEQTPTSTLSKLQSKMRLLERETKETLKMFSTADWANFKESSFSKPLKDFAAAQGAAAAQGDESCMENARDWVAGVATAKRFAQLHRHTQKSKGNLLTEKFAELAPVLADLVAFLHKVGVTPLAATLLLYHCRATFHGAFANEASVATAAEEMMSKGFATPDFCAALTATSPPVNLNIWLRSMFWETFAQQLRNAAVSDQEAALQNLGRDLTTCLSLFQDMQCEDIAEFTKDLAAMHVVFDCSEAEQDARVVKDAVTRVSGATLADFRKGLEKNELWLSVMSAATSAMLLGAQDTLAENTPTRAAKYVADERLPSIRKTKSEAGLVYTFTNVAGIVDGTAVASLAESVDLVVECFSLWNTGSAAEKAGVLHEWADAVVERLQVISDAMWFAVIAAFAAAGFQDFDLSATSAARISEIVEEHFCEEDPFRDFLAKFQKQLAKFPVLAERLPSYDGVFKELAAQSESRTAAVDGAMMLLTLETLPESPQKALDDWRAKSFTGNVRESFLEKGTSLWSHFRKTLPEQPSPPTPAAEVADEVCIIVGANSATVSWTKLGHVFTDLLNHPLAQRIAETLRDALQIAFDHFASTLPLKVMTRSVTAETTSFYSGNTSDLFKASAKFCAAPSPDRKSGPRRSR